MLIDIMNDHGLEQLVHFPTREKNKLDSLLTSLPGVIFRIFTHRTNSVIMILLLKRDFDSCHSPQAMLKKFVCLQLPTHVFKVVV